MTWLYATTSSINASEASQSATTRTRYPSPSSTRAAPVAPGQQCTARSAPVINNGGSGGVHQPLAADKPVLAIPANMDQYLAMQHMLEAALSHPGEKNGGNFLTLI